MYFVLTVTNPNPRLPSTITIIDAFSPQGSFSLIIEAWHSPHESAPIGKKDTSGHRRELFGIVSMQTNSRRKRPYIYIYNCTNIFTQKRPTQCKCLVSQCACVHFGKYVVVSHILRHALSFVICRAPFSFSYSNTIGLPLVYFWRGNEPWALVRIHSACQKPLTTSSCTLHLTPLRPLEGERRGRWGGVKPGNVF